MKLLTNSKSPSRKPKPSSEGSQDRNYDSAFRTMFRVNECFIEGKKNLYIYFSLQPGSLKIEKHKDIKNRINFINKIFIS
jgi:hypothetical protein